MQRVPRRVKMCGPERTHYDITLQTYYIYIKIGITMALKLKTLLEGYAWERKADGSLPTLRDSIAVHEANSGARPDFLDLDKDRNTAEPMKSAAKDAKLKEGRNDHGLLDLVSDAENIVQRIRSNMATNSVLQRTEKMGYLGAFDELLGVLSEIGYQSEMMDDN